MTPTKKMKNKDSQKLGNVTWNTGDECNLGTITEFFTAGGEIQFFTHSGAFYPLRYLHGERKKKK